MKLQKNISLAIALLFILGLPISVGTGNIILFLIIFVVLAILAIYHARAISKLANSYEAMENDSRELQELKNKTIQYESELQELKIEKEKLSDELSKYKTRIEEFEKQNHASIEQSIKLENEIFSKELAEATASNKEEFENTSIEDVVEKNSISALLGKAKAANSNLK